MTTPQTLKGFRDFLPVGLTYMVNVVIIYILKPPALTQVEAGVFYSEK